MADKLMIQNGKVLLVTEEGQKSAYSEAELTNMFRQETLAPIGQSALPDGVKFVEWRPPLLAVVHQLPAHVRQLRWIDNKSRQKYGPGTKYRTVRISIPYAITIALYCQHKDSLALTGYNELYFRNEPLRSKSDRLGFPALLNISAIPCTNRTRAWICTQHLQFPRRADWTTQLAALLDHTWNGGFNLSSEHHEGASWYGESKGIHKSLHPIEKWEQATKANEAFALSVPWKPAPLNVGQLVDSMIDECRDYMHMPEVQAGSKSKAANISDRFINFVQRQSSAKKHSA